MPSAVSIAVHTALWSHHWGEDLAPHIQRAAEIGFDGAEISLLGLTERQCSQLAMVADSAGLSLKCTTGLAPSEDITSADPAVRRVGRDALARAADLVATLRSDLLAGVIYAPWGSYGDPTTRAARQARAAETLAIVAPAFADRGITLGIEAVNRFETDLINTASEALALVAAIGAPNVGVHLDAFHMNIEERTIGEAIESAAGHLAHIHVSGPDRGVPSKGRVPWSEIFTALKRVSYSGWLGVEMFVRPGLDVSPDLRIWREIAASPDGAAADALAFLRSHLT